MEVFFNELSINPVGTEPSTGRARIYGLLCTMKSLRESQFTVLRTHDGFFADQIAEGYSCLDFLRDEEVPRIQKELLQTVCRNPFIANENSEEAEYYILNSFSTLGHTCETIVPEGLAAAHIHGSPVVSFASHPHWQKEKLVINVHETNGETSQESIWNFWNEEGIELWTEQEERDNNEILLNSKENIYRVFPGGEIEFDERALEEFIAWFYDDKRYQKRIIKLIADIPKNPFNGGLGRAEVLSGEGMIASKRIVGRDRLVYTYYDNRITVHSCRGHYDDH